MGGVVPQAVYPQRRTNGGALAETCRFCDLEATPKASFRVSAMGAAMRSIVPTGRKNAHAVCGLGQGSPNVGEKDSFSVVLNLLQSASRCLWRHD